MSANLLTFSRQFVSNYTVAYSSITPNYLTHIYVMLFTANDSSKEQWWIGLVCPHCKLYTTEESSAN